MTRWRPDTCGCVLSIETDATATGDFYGGADGHRVVQVEARCPDHAALPDVALYQAVREESARKNLLRLEILAADGITPAQQQEIAELEAEGKRLGIPEGFLMTPAQLQLYARIKSLLSFTFSFTPTRVLIASFDLKSPMTAALRTQIQGRADTRFGPGKVKIV